MTSPKKVHLGIAVLVEPSQLFSLERHYLPLGKCGGYPAWLNPAKLPPCSELLCQNCGSPMAFLLQVYCPAEPTHAFHRIIYVFVCPKGACSKTNNASNFAAFRCQLPRENAFYSPIEALNPSTDGEISDPYFDPNSYAKLCSVCGCHAPKRCARCAQRWYCSRDHQIIDWNAMHKGQCKCNANKGPKEEMMKEVAVTSIEKDANQRARHGFTFKEFGIELCSEENDCDDDDENSDEGSDEDGKSKMDQESALAEKFGNLAHANGLKTGQDLDGLEESRRDSCFDHFNSANARCPEQILRYQRGGEPLLATDHSPVPSNLRDCELCGAKRQFELQLMPSLVALMGFDAVGTSIDWATLMVYTCAASCPIPDSGYARELVLKQDFVAPPPENEDKNRQKIIT